MNMLYVSALGQENISTSSCPAFSHLNVLKVLPPPKKIQCMDSELKGRSDREYDTRKY